VFLFSFKGQMRPLAYALWSLVVFFSQHIVVLATSKLLDQPLTCAWAGSLLARPAACFSSFLVMPLHSMVELGYTSTVMLLLAFAYSLMAAWCLAALAFRRAADAQIVEWIAAFVIAPIVQIPAILILCILPSRRATVSSAAVAASAAPRSDWMAAMQGGLAGMGLTLVSVALGALLFGAYGFGMFVVSPFVIGATTAYLANRRGDIGSFRTAPMVLAAAALGGAALLVVALEGIVCIILAAPLAGIVAVAGGMFGRQVALYSRHSGRQTLSSLILLPLVFGVEHVVSVATTFDTSETVFADAPPQVVWNAIVHMEALDAPTALPFRLGVAYPLGGEILGEGVGAIRYGAFSTGTALERVTEWVPDRRIAFTVLKDVPGMRELSPYSRVHAPHVVGYFTTKTMSFDLSPQPDGRTKVIERTSHTLKLDPAFYWLPLARWIVHENNTRVLEHIRRQSERDFHLASAQ
jgi:uncharacterized membrane protein YhaH (DUF805 family)